MSLAAHAYRAEVVLGLVVEILRTAHTAVLGMTNSAE